MDIALLYSFCVIFAASLPNIVEIGWKIWKLENIHVMVPQAVVLYGAAAQKMAIAKSYSFGVALGVSLVSQPNIVKLGWKIWKL